MKLPTLLFPEIDKANHYAYGTGVAAVAAVATMALLAAVYRIGLHLPPPAWLPLAGAVSAAVMAYATGRIKERFDAEANAIALAAGEPPPHGVETADWQATTWGCVPAALPLLAAWLLPLLAARVAA